MASPAEDAASGTTRTSPGRDVPSESIATYLAQLASATPAPGGGSAAALAGALAAALVAMVCRVTAAREPAAADLATAAGAADRIRQRLTALAGADADAYEALLAARRLPADARASAMRVALRRATEVPLDLVEASRDVLGLCARAAPQARASTLGDLQVAAALARGALDGGAVTVRINLRDSTDTDFPAAAGRKVDALAAEGHGLIEQVLNAIAARAARGE